MKIIYFLSMFSIIFISGCIQQQPPIIKDCRDLGCEQDEQCVLQDNQYLCKKIVENRTEIIALQSTIDKIKDVAITMPAINKCEAIFLSSDNYKEKVNIVVIGHGFSDFSDFKNKAAQLFLNAGTSFAKTEPVKTRKSDFNIWIYPNQQTSLNFTDRNSIIETGKQCPMNFIVVLDNTGKNYLHGAGTFTILDKLSTALLNHELAGHLIGSLEDEYADLVSSKFASFVSRYELNCDYNATCSKFNGISIEGCFKGCNRAREDASTYRASDTSVMRALSQNYFNAVQKFIINRRIDNILKNNIK